MKKLLLLPVFFVATVFLTGCPLETKVPIDAPEQLKVDITGKWQVQTDNNGGDIYNISKADNTQFNVKVLKGLDSGATYKTYFNRIGNQVFATVANMVDGDTHYTIFRFRKANDTIFVAAVSDKKVTREFNVPGDLKAFLKQNLQKDIYDEEDRMVKIK